MPGIFGFCSQRPSDDVHSIADRMRLAMRHQPWYVDDFYAAPSRLIAGGRISLSHRPHAVHVGADLDPVVLFDGEIYDASDHRRKLESDGATFRTNEDAELLAHGLARWGTRFLARLEGYFSAAVWKPADRTLLLISDRFGMKPLYYSLVDGGIVFASEIKAILKHPGVSRGRSLKGVAQFFTFGHFLGNETLFESIRTVPAAAAYGYDTGRGTLAASQYWQLEPGTLIRQREALTRLDVSFAYAVERRIGGPGQLGLSLSGGLDARTILAAIPKGSAHVKSMSIGIRGSIDHRAAGRLAMLAGAEHHCELLKGDFINQFPVHLKRLVFLTDGHYLDQGITVPTLPVYRELGIQTLLRGHAGELLHMDKAYAFSVRRDDLSFQSTAALERWLWSHLTAYMIEGVGHDMFRPALRPEAAALAAGSLTDALGQTAHVDPIAQRIWHMFVRERLRRETAMSMQLFNSVVDVRLPYMDSDFVEVSMRVAPDLKMGDTIQTFILGHRSPQFLKVVNANNGTLPGAWRGRKGLGVMRLRVLAKLGVSGYQPYERLGLWLSRELHPFVADTLLSDRSLDRGLFDPQRLRQIVTDHRERRKNHTFLLMAMLIFEIGQRQFVDEDAMALG
jgi:asparagine synthase (glutamine-hydrolysing)